jgi:hypothetical protein
MICFGATALAGYVERYLFSDNPPEKEEFIQDLLTFKGNNYTEWGSYVHDTFQSKSYFEGEAKTCLPPISNVFAPELRNFDKWRFELPIVYHVDDNIKITSFIDGCFIHNGKPHCAIEIKTANNTYGWYDKYNNSLQWMIYKLAINAPIHYLLFFYEGKEWGEIDYSEIKDLPEILQKRYNLWSSLNKINGYEDTEQYANLIEQFGIDYVSGLEKAYKRVKTESKLWLYPELIGHYDFEPVESNSEEQIQYFAGMFAQFISQDERLLAHYSNSQSKRYAKHQDLIKNNLNYVL